MSLTYATARSPTDPYAAPSVDPSFTYNGLRSLRPPSLDGTMGARLRNRSFLDSPEVPGSLEASFTNSNARRTTPKKSSGQPSLARCATFPHSSIPPPPMGQDFPPMQKILPSGAPSREGSRAVKSSRNHFFLF